MDGASSGRSAKSSLFGWSFFEPFCKIVTFWMEALRAGASGRFRKISCARILQPCLWLSRADSVHPAFVQLLIFCRFYTHFEFLPSRFCILCFDTLGPILGMLRADFDVRFFSAALSSRFAALSSRFPDFAKSVATAPVPI